MKSPLQRWLVLFATVSLMILPLVTLGCQKQASGGSDTHIAFSTKPDEALSQAARENKIVMVDVYTDWCTWCKKLDEDVYAKPAVASALQKDFVALKVNPEKADKAFVDKYGVEGFPTILFLNGEGKEVHRIVGYVPETDFLRELDTARQKAASV